MKKLTIAQMTLLRAAATDGGTTSAAGSHATVASLIQRGLLTRKDRKGSESKLLATKAGKAVLADCTTVAAAAELVSNAPPEHGAKANQALSGPQGKIGLLVSLLRQSEGATLAAMVAATGWQAHSVRGAMAGAIKKKLQLPIISEKTGPTRTWRIVETRA